MAPTPALKIVFDNRLQIFEIPREKVEEVGKRYGEPVLAIPIDESRWTFFPYCYGTCFEDNLVEYVAETLGEEFSKVICVA